MPSDSSPSPPRQRTVVLTMARQKECSPTEPSASQPGTLLPPRVELHLESGQRVVKLALRSWVGRGLEAGTHSLRQCVQSNRLSRLSGYLAVL